VFRTKAEFAYDKLKKQILVGKWAPNQRLILNILTQELSLSVIPIREALKHLEKEGFVVQIPHQGYSVAAMCEEELYELMLLREALEITALPKIIDKITLEEIKDLYRLTEEMKEIHEALKKDQENDELQDQFRVINRLFHRTIVSAAGFIHFPEMLDNLMDLSNRYLNLVESLLGIRAVDIKEHVAIVDGIANKDVKAVVKLLKQHYRRVQNEFSTQISTNRRLVNGIFRVV
jgi:DNA-binding GntR family transcriptional regulator